MVTDMSIEAATEKTKKGMAEYGIPIGAVLLHEGRMIGWGTTDEFIATA